jgi:hypothetical protein
MSNDLDEDLGFTFRIGKNNDLEICHHGKLATRFSGGKAAKSASQLALASFAEQQQIMARLTGNYKRGNERTARTHQRNRR